MRKTIRTLAGVAALATLAVGLIQPVDQETRWLIALWVAAPLLVLTVWLSQPAPPQGIARSVFHLGLVIAVGFGLLSMQLLRQQVVWAAVTYSRVEVDPASGQAISNVRPILAAQRILRGTIYDDDGVPLVTSAMVNGFAYRTYPLAERFDPGAFSNIVGFVSSRFSQSGVEATFSEYLTGARGNPIERLRDDLLGRTQVGNDLYLTIDAELQAQAYNLLAGRVGSVVVLDPQTGAVRAMASFPGFDPRQLTFNPAAADWEAENERISNYWEGLNSDAARQPLLNRPAQGQYPPGSTFKTVTAVAALEYPTVAQPDDIRCYNQLDVEAGAPPIVNAVEGLAGLTGDPSNLERVYAYSCNVAFAQYALRLGADRLSNIAERFDIYTPADAPAGAYREFDDLYAVPSRLYVQAGFLNQPRALADTGYGQGQLLTTPLQMALVAAAIGNDGIMMRPYLVERVVRPDGTPIVEQRPRPIRRTMSPQTAATMREHMQAVAQYGFGESVSDFVPGVAVGGKSGTAQHAPGASPHAWFIALAPIEEPRYAVAVMLESGGEGSGAGAALAGQVLQAALAIE